MNQPRVPVTRRDLLRAGALALASSGLPFHACAARRRPDVLFLAIDDLNDWVGCLGGHPQARTPNLDRLARAGVLFRNAHCPAPVCNPSRTSVLTGIPPWVHGIYGNGVSFRRVLPAAISLPQHLARHGYRVEGGGKVFHSAADDRSAWGEYFSPVATTGTQRLRGLTLRFDWGPRDVPLAASHDGLLAAWGAERWRQRGGVQPLFLALGFTGPHLPWYTPPDLFGAFPAAEVTLPPTRPDDLDDVPDAGRLQAVFPADFHARIVERGLWGEAVAAYLAAVLAFDTTIGELVDLATAAAGEAIVVLWSDHGWHLGEKGHWRKWTLWEEATRVPLMIAGPPVARAGSVCDLPVSTGDLFATIVELCDLEPVPPPAATASLSRLLRHPRSAGWPPAVTTLNRSAAVRSEHWRYIRYWDGSEELYDHRTDPHEWHNLAASAAAAAVKAELAAALPASLADVRLDGERVEG
jgi:arylsulfatase A-like enzyme